MKDEFKIDVFLLVCVIYKLITTDIITFFDENYANRSNLPFYIIFVKIRFQRQMIIIIRCEKCVFSVLLSLIAHNPKWDFRHLNISIEIRLNI